MIPDDIFLKIVRSAVKAPSGHNTQPWLFAKEEDGICIIPDFSRSLSVADPNHRELFISLGCAAETAMIAARLYGYNPNINFDLLESDSKIRIALTKSEKLEEPDLYSFINIRQTTRNLYYDTPISDDDLIKLIQIVAESGIDVEFHIGKEKINTFVPYILEANTIQMSNPDFKNELIQWFRFSEKEAMQKGDGLYAACSGVPSMGRLPGSFVLKNFVTAKSENKRLLKQLKKSAAVVLFTSPNDSVGDLIKTGMAFQRFALTATKLDLSQSYINLPCQITEVRDKMMNDLGLVGFPQLLIRLGYSQKMHYSFRRRINDVILK